MLLQMFPEYPIPTRCSDEVNPRKKPYNLSNKKIKDLGFTFTPIKQSLYDTVTSLQDKGHLPVLAIDQQLEAEKKQQQMQLQLQEDAARNQDARVD